MREKKKSGKAESFRAKIITSSDQSLLQSLIEAYICSESMEITKMYELPSIHRGSLGKSHKKWSTAGQTGGIAGCENSQPTKFRNL